MFQKVLLGGFRIETVVGLMLAFCQTINIIYELSSSKLSRTHPEVATDVVGDVGESEKLQLHLRCPGTPSLYLLLGGMILSTWRAKNLSHLLVSVNRRTTNCIEKKALRISYNS